MTRTTPSLSDIVITVAYCAGVDVGVVRPEKRNGFVGIATVIANDLGGFTSAEIAEPLGFRSKSAVEKQLQRGRSRIAASDDHRLIYEKAVELLEQRRAA